MGQHHSTEDFNDIRSGLGGGQMRKRAPKHRGEEEGESGMINTLTNYTISIWDYITKRTPKPITHVNWNILADGLGNDGFVTPTTLPTSAEFQASVLTLTNSRKELNGYESVDNCPELMSAWLKTHPEFNDYQKTLDKLLEWESDSLIDTDWDDFYNVKNLNAMEEFITTVGYPGRGPVMVKKLELVDADIITMQEMDKYTYFVDQLEEYSSSIGEEPYQRVGLSSVSKSRGKELLVSSPSDYEAYLARKDHAFIPKLNSTSYSLNPKKMESTVDSVDPEEPDNDGSCIFWKEDRFNCLEIDYRLLQPEYENKKGIFKATGIVYAQLCDKNDGTIAHVFSTHLTSGNKDKEETVRVGEIQRVNQFIKEKFDNSKGLHGQYIILGMDGNSYQGFSAGDFDETCNMYSFLTKEGLLNYEPVVPDDDKHITWSVNKIRGPMTNQIRKIGVYQLDRIDYSATSSNLTQVDNVDQERIEQMARSPRYTATTTDMSKKEIYGKMLPNMFNPSDHLPVIASYILK